MNLLAYILAESDDSGWVRIVVVALFIGLSLIGSVFQKAKEKQQKNNARKPGAPPEQATAPRPQFVQPKRLTQPPVIQPRQAPEEQPVRVSQELRLSQQRQVKLEAERQQRLTMRGSPEADSKAISNRLVSLRPVEADAALLKIGEIAVIPQLDTPAETQRAIIMHEIFSPPKALRTGGEMWDE